MKNRILGYKIFVLSNLVVLSFSFAGNKSFNDMTSAKALNELSPQVGVLNKSNINLSFNVINNLIKIKMEKYTEYNGYSPVRNKILSDFDNNIFVLTEFAPTGYGIYNVVNGDIVELSTSSNSPYKNLDGKFYYVPLNGYYKKINNSYVNIFDNKFVSLDKINDLSNYSSLLHEEATKHVNYTNIELVKNGEFSIYTHESDSIYNQNNIASTSIDDLYQSADVEVPYSWYFKLNHNSYPENTSGVCGYVALALILGYTEIFKSAGYFSEEEASKYIVPFNGSPRTGVPTITNDFLSEFGENLGGTIPGDLTRATNLFMEGKDKVYEIYEYLWRFSTITDPIKDGVPAAYFGNYSDTILNTGNHVTVVCGYDNDGMLLLHTGWYNSPGDINNFTNIKISRLGFFKEGGVFALYNKSPHDHSDYFHLSDGRKKCGCGTTVEY